MSSFIGNLFKSKPDPAIENLRSVMAAIDKERTLDRSFATKAAGLETAVKEAVYAEVDPGNKVMA